MYLCVKRLLGLVFFIPRLFVQVWSTVLAIDLKQTYAVDIRRELPEHRDAGGVDWARWRWDYFVGFVGRLLTCLSNVSFLFDSCLGLGVTR